MTKQVPLILHGQAQQDSMNKAAIQGQNPSSNDGGIDQLKLSDPNQVDQDATKLPNHAEQDIFKIPQEVQESVRSEPANEGLNQPVPEVLFSTSPAGINEKEQDSPQAIQPSKARST